MIGRILAKLDFSVRRLVEGWCSKTTFWQAGRRGKLVDAINYSAARKSVFGVREVV
jgi:hypothetical protein